MAKRIVEVEEICYSPNGYPHRYRSQRLVAVRPETQTPVIRPPTMPLTREVIDIRNNPQTGELEPYRTGRIEVVEPRGGAKVSL